MCSNWDPNVPVPSGSQYTITINTQLPIYLIVAMTGIGGIAALEAFISKENIQHLLAKNGYTGTIQNYKTNIDWWGTKITISFTASSPPVTLILYVALAALAVIGLYIIYMTVNIIAGPSSGPGGQVVKTGIGIFLIGAGALALYYIYKKVGGKKK
jgi:hypothetical protein